MTSSARETALRALLEKWLKAASGDAIGDEYSLPLDTWGTGTKATADMEEADLERELLAPTRALLAATLPPEPAAVPEAAPASETPTVDELRVYVKLPEDALTHIENLETALRQAHAALRAAEQRAERAERAWKEALDGERASYRVGYMDAATGQPPQVQLTEPEQQQIRALAQKEKP